MRLIPLPVNLERAAVSAMRIFVIHAALAMGVAIVFAGMKIPVTIVRDKAAVEVRNHLSGTN
jgi:hypothetical protein